MYNRYHAFIVTLVIIFINVTKSETLIIGDVDKSNTDKDTMIILVFYFCHISFIDSNMIPFIINIRL